jgi:hypothetical protein
MTMVIPWQISYRYFARLYRIILVFTSYLQLIFSTPISIFLYSFDSFKLLSTSLSLPYFSLIPFSSYCLLTHLYQAVIWRCCISAAVCKNGLFLRHSHSEVPPIVTKLGDHSLIFDGNRNTLDHTNRLFSLNFDVSEGISVCVFRHKRLSFLTDISKHVGSICIACRIQISWKFTKLFFVVDQVS